MKAKNIYVENVLYKYAASVLDVQRWAANFDCAARGQYTLCGHSRARHDGNPFLFYVSTRWNFNWQYTHLSDLAGRAWSPLFVSSRGENYSYQFWGCSQRFLQKVPTSHASLCYWHCSALPQALLCQQLCHGLPCKRNLVSPLHLISYVKTAGITFNLLFVCIGLLVCFLPAKWKSSMSQWISLLGIWEETEKGLQQSSSTMSSY